MLKVVILGSTGSLGIQTLQVLDKHKKHFKVIALSANENFALLHKQAEKFGVKSVVLAEGGKQKELCKLAKLKDADIIVNVLSGVAGINPSFAALKNGKILLLGNKESLVAEGEKIIVAISHGKKSALIPLDSEHNAIHEILKKYPDKKIKNIFLPCSGGPFINKTKKELEKITPAQALKHPKWQMGNKISIESATLLNKGLEIIEAHYLFKLPLTKIKVFLHPQCQIHGVVEFEDGKKIAYSAKPNMAEHIENALLECLGQIAKRKIEPIQIPLRSPKNQNLRGIEIVKKTFLKNPTRMKKFLKIEEKAVNDFLKGEISFLKIFLRLA